MSPRIYDFHGSQDEYTALLEAEILRIGRWRCSCGRSVDISSEIVAQIPSQCPSNDLRIEQWKPGLAARKRRRSETPPWTRHAEQLVKMTPSAKTWRRVMERNGLYEAIHTGSAIQHLLGNEHGTNIDLITTTHSDTGGWDGGTSILGRVTAYAQIAARKHEGASLALMLANFQKFIALSACVVVAASQNLAKESIYEIVRICLGNVSDDYCRRMLHTTKYINTLIDTLAINGWDGRAAELFLLCRCNCVGIVCTIDADLCSGDRKPTFYYNLARSPHDSLEHFKTALSKPHLTQTTETWPKCNSFFVPGMVSHVVQKQIQ